jgi:hypothetical protein
MCARRPRATLLAMRLLAVVAAGAALAAACGGPSAVETVRSTWTDAARAVADGAGTRFCALASIAGRQAIQARTSLPCEDSVRLLAGQLTAADKAAIRGARITAVEVEGDTAVVTYELGRRLAKFGFTGETTMVREEGEWRLQGI